MTDAIIAPARPHRPDGQPGSRRSRPLGAAVLSPIQDVGEGIKVATVGDPEGNLIGLIENPHFRLPG